MSFRYQVLHQAGLFDERFTGNAQFEETDLSFRIRELGYKLIYDPIPAVQHLSAATGGCRNIDKIAWYHDYLFNKGLFFSKNMPLRTHLLFFIAHGIIAIREGILRGQSINKTLNLLNAMVSGYQLGRRARR